MKILLDVFQYKAFTQTVSDSIEIGTITPGLSCPGTHIGYITMDPKLGAQYTGFANYPTTFLSYYHLQFLTAKLKQLNEKEAARKEISEASS